VYYGYLTKITKELQTIIPKIWGEKDTLLTYGGIGDLLMTTNSKTSRNFTFGYKIGSKVSQEEKEKYIKENTIEGYLNLQLILKFLNKWKIKNSMIEKIYQIVINEANPIILYDQTIEKNEIF